MGLNNDDTNKSLQKIQSDYDKGIQNITEAGLPGLLGKNDRALNIAKRKIAKEMKLDAENLFEEGMKIKKDNPDISKEGLTTKIFEKLANNKNKTLSKLAKDILKEGRY